MKKRVTLPLLMGICAVLVGCSSQGSGGINLWSFLLVVAGLGMAALAALRTYSLYQYNRRARGKSRRKPRKTLDQMTLMLFGLAAVALVIGILLGGISGKEKPNPKDTVDSSANSSASDSSQSDTSRSPYVAAATAVSAPANWGIRWEIFDGAILQHSFTRAEPITFGDGEDYFALPGIATFRGNNYRNSPTYGTAEVTEQTLSQVWTSKTGTIAGSEYSGSTWTGSGWTGQPLIVKWDDATKQIMNLYAEKKEKADLVEVIYATLDGKIYFLDLEDGSYTRDPINVGLAFKGAGSLDPRGYPLMYVGSGDVNANGDRPRMYIISLVEGKILYEYGHEETLAYRTDNDSWCAFDSAPLVDAQTDTLIWPGENGLLYTIDLNTSYDQAAGTISIDPAKPVIARYHTARSNEDSYWYGYEASANIVENYLYVSENGGMFYCVDLNTMELVWAQDTKDDSNSSPVFSRISNQEAYIYTAPSLHWTKDATHHGTVSIYKLNALTGEIVWEKPYDVGTITNLSGGIQSTPLLGKAGSELDGMIFYAIARTPETETGLLVALDTETGEEIWRMNMEHYPWSSPVAVYEKDGTGYVVICDTNGNMFFLNGQTGQVLDSINLGGTIQASPAVYEDMLVVGTRKSLICGIQVG